MKQAREGYLLLIAAGECADGLANGARFNVEFFDHAFRLFALPLGSRRRAWQCRASAPPTGRMRSIQCRDIFA